MSFNWENQEWSFNDLDCPFSEEEPLDHPLSGSIFPFSNGNSTPKDNQIHELYPYALGNMGPRSNSAASIRISNLGTNNVVYLSRILSFDGSSVKRKREGYGRNGTLKCSFCRSSKRKVASANLPVYI
jgi:hypothetical protein